MRWIGHLFFGCGVIGIAINMAWKLFMFNSTKMDSLSFITFLIATTICFIVGIINLIMSYGYKFGRVDKVIGARKSAILIRRDRPLGNALPVKFMRNIDKSDLNEAEANQDIFFIWNWRPWVCSLSQFLINESSQPGLDQGRTGGGNLR